jgi:hypothetical protein
MALFRTVSGHANGADPGAHFENVLAIAIVIGYV